MRSSVRSCVVVAAAGALLPGCESTAPTDDAPESRLEASVPAPDFQPMLVVPLPSLEAAEPSGAALESLVARDTPLAELLLTLFRDSDINLMVDTDADGVATFDIKNTTVEEAFEAILRSVDVTWEWDGSFLHVRRVERRTFDVDLPNFTAAEPGGAESAAGGGSEFEPWSRIEQDLEELVGESATVLVNREAGTVTVEARPSAVRRVRDYLDRTMLRMTNQVSLEARVLEVQLDDEFRLGVQWSLLPGFFGSDLTGTLEDGAMVAQQAASGGTAFNVGLLNDGNFEVFVDALERQGQVRVLSSPRIATLNNVPATIRVVRQIPIIDREVIDSLGGLRTQFDIRFTEAGVTLTVTPQVGADGVVTCQLAPRVTEQIGVITTPDGLQTEPILAVRETSTSVRVPDGQTIVVGGLRSTLKTEEVRGLPLLMDIPLLGVLFRSTVQTRNELELMVLLVPRIIDAAWREEELRRGLHRLTTLRRPFALNSLGLDGFRAERYAGGLLQGSVSGAAEPSVELKQAAAESRASSSLTVSRSGLAGALVRRARAALGRHETAQAIASLEQAATLDERRLDVRIAAGLLRARQNHLARAREHLEQALAVAPEDAHVRLARGIVDVLADAPRAAIAHLRLAHESIGDATTACDLGAALLMAGDFQGAAALLGEFADGDCPPELHANLAYAQLRLGDVEQAHASLERALDAGASPRHAQIRTLSSLLGEAPDE